MQPSSDPACHVPSKSPDARQVELLLDTENLPQESLAPWPKPGVQGSSELKLQDLGFRAWGLGLGLGFRV